MRSTDRGITAPPAIAPRDGLAGIPSVAGEGGAFVGWLIDGGRGDDRISGSPYFDEIVGGPGSDVLDGHGGDGVFVQGGERGTDAITGGARPCFDGGTLRSIDKVAGGEGDDVLLWTSAARRRGPRSCPDRRTSRAAGRQRGNDDGAACSATLRLARIDGTPLAAAPVTDPGGGRRTVVAVPAHPIGAGEPVAIRVAGRFDGFRSEHPDSSFDYGWATSLG